MKTVFRPIPLTLLDFLGVLLPGCAWLLLFSAIIELIRVRSTGPEAAWKGVEDILNKGGGWPLILIFLSLIIGYSLKPISMWSAERLTKTLFKLSRNTRRYHSRDMVFPFKVFFYKNPYYPKVTSILTRLCGVDFSEGKPGKNSPFNAAKRYLRLISPTLWEESERMEAQVRMIGGLFLVGFCAFFLSALVIGYNMFSITFSIKRWPTIEEIFFLVSSFVATLVLGIGFNRSRIREVEYTYLNMLLAEGHRIEAMATQMNTNTQPES